jgi:N-methylhydantoinase A/oxoprolinase/acetone carboxylase beta subunit
VLKDLDDLDSLLIVDIGGTTLDIAHVAQAKCPDLPKRTATQKPAYHSLQKPLNMRWMSV